MSAAVLYRKLTDGCTAADLRTIMSADPRTAPLLEVLEGDDVGLVAWRLIEQAWTTGRLAAVLERLAAARPSAGFAELTPDLPGLDAQQQRLLLSFSGKISVGMAAEVGRRIRVGLYTDIGAVVASYSRAGHSLVVMQLTPADALELMGADELLCSLSLGALTRLESLSTLTQTIWSREGVGARPYPPPARQAPRLGGLLTGAALIGVLTMIMYPNFVSMSFRAKRAEAPAHVDGIKIAEVAYGSAFDSFVEQTSFVPDDDPKMYQRTWPQSTNFNKLGWAPDGKVRGSYRVHTVSEAEDFIVGGIIDIDDDDINAVYTATKTTDARLLTSNSIW